MTMNIIPGTSNLSSDCNRRVTIEVVGGRNQEPARRGVYTITVPFSCFSKTLQGISRRGGTVISVSATTSQSDMASSGQQTSRSGRARAQKRGNTRMMRRQATRIQPAKQQRKNQTSSDKPLSETFLKRLFASN